MVPVRFKRALLERALQRFAPFVLASKDPELYLHYQVMRKTIASLESPDSIEDEKSEEEKIKERFPTDL